MIDRRTLIQALAVGSGSLSYGPLIRQAFGQTGKRQLSFLDRDSYLHGMTLHGVFREHALGRMQMQMFAEGNRRLFFTDTHVLDVSAPLTPKLVNSGAWEGGGPGREPTLAYNERIQKWILIVGENAPGAGNKYLYRSRVERSLNYRGLRGVRIYDASDPENIELLSKWSVDQGDPEREIQTGEGCFRIFYDGGRYAYLNAGPDNSFTRMEHPGRHYTRCLQIIDIEDPLSPKFVSNCWVPGQKEGEDEQYREWPEFNDQASWTSANSRFYVPRRVEDGGQLCFGTWGALGFRIHDVSDPENPRHVATFRTEEGAGSIDFYNCDLSWLNRNLVVAHSEMITPDCNASVQLPWVLDISDPTAPTGLSRLPLPEPPPEAPYSDFCEKRGRFGPRYTPPLVAPGRVDRNLSCVTYFNGGLQCFDIEDPRRPVRVAYFVPPQAGELEDQESFLRSTEGVFVEWDRRLIWVGTDTGLYLLSSPHLGEPVLEPMPVSEWTLPQANRVA